MLQHVINMATMKGTLNSADLDVMNKVDPTTSVSCTKIAEEDSSLQCFIVRPSNLAMNKEFGIPVSALNTVKVKVCRYKPDVALGIPGG
jgi:hypothetical protein